MNRAAVSVIGLFLFIYILPLGVRPMTVPDESRYSEIPREMLASGEWVVPHLNGVLYFEKPVLGYWINALSISLLGENAFAVRLPSALAVGISALLIFLLMRGLRGGSQAGILAAAAFLTCLQVSALGAINLLDSMFSMFLTGAMVSFFRAHMAGTPLKRNGFLALFGALCGLAFLVKGFLAFAVPVVTIVPFMLWEKQGKRLFTIPWIPLLTALGVALPWCVMIHLREGDFWNYFFWNQHISRFISPLAGQHPKPFWYFIPVLFAGALPWMALVPAIISGARRTRSSDPLIRFAICWFLFPFIFFSISSGKLIPYILPCFPPLIVLMTVSLLDYFDAGKQKAFRICAACLALLLGILGVLLMVSQVTELFGPGPYGKAEMWKSVLGGLSLLFWGLILSFSARATGPKKRLALYCAAPLLFLFIGSFIIPDRVMERRAPERLLLRNADRVHSDTLLVSDEYLVHAVCWFYKRDNVSLLEKGGELTYGLKHNDSLHPRLLTVKGLDAIIGGTSGGHGIALITELGRYEKIKDLLPKPRFEDIDAGFVFLVF